MTKKTKRLQDSRYYYPRNSDDDIVRYGRQQLLLSVKPGANLIMPDGVTSFDLCVIKNFLDPETCKKIADETRSSPGSPATVYGRSESGTVDERVRKGAKIIPSQGTLKLVMSRLMETRGHIEEHFGMNLSQCEEPQFLRYREGDFFVAHQDGNTGLLKLSREETRKISAVLFLSSQSETPEPDTFCGGSLVFSGRAHRDFAFAAEAGTFVAFRAETTHEVTPITYGERLSIISWYG